jgi:hypothetical protein
LHVSLEHALPSSGHAAPLGSFTTVQPPLPSHVELAWQLVGVHVYAVPPQVPAAHTSFFVQAFPSSHAAPSARLDHAVVEVAGAHARQALAGFTAPAAYSTPPMKHSLAHVPLAQT